MDFIKCDYVIFVECGKLDFVDCEIFGGLMIGMFIIYEMDNGIKLDKLIY